MKIEFLLKFVRKYSNIKFHENPSSGSRVVPYERTDGPTKVTKLIVDFRNFASGSKIATTDC